MEYKILINNEELTEYTIIPLNEQTTLDESLDQGYLKLAYTDKTSAYKPFTSVDIEVKDDFNNKRELNYFIASDKKTEIIASGTYTHEILLIEQSKWLERFLTGTKTVTNPLVHDYMSTTRAITFEHNYAKPNGSIDQFIGYYEDNSGLEAPQLSGYELTLPTLQEWFDTNIKNNFAVNWTALESGELTIKNADTGATITTITNKTQSFTMTLEEEITLQVSYWLYVSRSSGAQTTYFKDIFTFSTIDQLAPKPNKTITDAVNDLLATIETIRESETPRFTFNSTQATKYAQVEAPEFILTGTLWEALKQIGSYIHAIPRLKNNAIYFDELGSNEKVSQDLSDYISNVEQFDIEQYASVIDSTVQNIVNLDDMEEGATTEPFETGYRTPRTDTGVVQITAGNLFIQTKEPIEQIIKVEMGYLSDDTYVGDITPYVYESAEYDTLSSYANQYPYAKAYAIKYTVGQKNITALNFKRENAVSPIFENYAIVNIASKVTGKSVSFIKNLISSENIQKLQFSVTYIPITEARLRQRKALKSQNAFESALPYNQSAQKISSIMYGEAMKGAIARLGNPEIVKMYILNDLSKIPKVGQLFDDDYYISVVKCEYYRDFVKCEIGLSKDYNKLNEYVGIKSEVRFYEISEKQATDRHINYEEYCVVGDEEETDGKSLITDAGLLQFSNMFEGAGLYNQVSAVQVKGDNNTRVVLPVTSYGVGNSLVFTFHYDDNYSAGETVHTESGSRLQNQVRYTDVYGEIEKLDLIMGAFYEEPYDYDDAVTKGDNYPLISEMGGNSRIYFNTDNDGIVIKKDNRETPKITYQIHFVSNRNGLIIGSGLARYSSLIRNGQTNFKLYILSEKIPKFAKTINISNATEYAFTFAPVVDEENKSVSLGSFYGMGGKAWAICQGDELIVGENIDMEFGNWVSFPTFTFTRRLQ